MLQKFALRIRWCQGQQYVNKVIHPFLDQFSYEYLVNLGNRRFEAKMVQISFQLKERKLLIDSEEVVRGIMKELKENGEENRRLSIIAKVVDKGQRYWGGGLKNEKVDGRQQKKENDTIFQKKVEQRCQKKQGKEQQKQERKVESRQNPSKLLEKEEQQVKEDAKDDNNPKKELKIDKNYQQKSKQEQKCQPPENGLIKPELEAKNKQEQQKISRNESLIPSEMDKGLQKQEENSINNSKMVLSDILNNQSNTDQQQFTMNLSARTQAPQLVFSIVQELSSVQNRSISENSEISKLYSLLGCIGEPISHTLGTKCCMCDQVLSEMPVYRCYYCYNNYFCWKCQILRRGGRNHGCQDHIMLKITSLSQFKVINPDAKFTSKKVQPDGNNNSSEMQFQEKLHKKKQPFQKIDEDFNESELYGDYLRQFLIDDRIDYVQNTDQDPQQKKREQDYKKRRQYLLEKQKQSMAVNSARNDQSNKKSEDEPEDKKQQAMLKKKHDLQQNKKIQQINSASQKMSLQKGQKQQEIKPAKKQQIDQKPAQQEKIVRKTKKKILSATELSLKQKRMKAVHKNMPQEQFNSYFTGQFENMNWAEMQLYFKKEAEKRQKES